MAEPLDGSEIYEEAHPVHLDAEGHEIAHTHIDENGNEYTHVHTHSHEHEHKRAVLNRISRAIGHMESIKRMVEDDRDCTEVLVQIAAVRAAINNTGKLILEDHIEHCVIDAVKTGDAHSLSDLEDAINKFIK